MELWFGGLTSGHGYPWGTYVGLWPRDPSFMDPNERFQIRVENTSSPGATEIATTGPALDPDATPGLVTGVTISGSGLTPTISWNYDDPTGETWRYITIFRLVDNDLNLIKPVHGTLIPQGTSSYQLPDQLNGYGSQETSLILGEQYLILINNLQVSSDGQRILGTSRAWFEFTAKDVSSGQAIYIPTVYYDAQGQKHFDFIFPVTANEQVFIDPDVAVGYDYETGEGDPGFRSVTLPDVGGGRFDLILFDDDGQPHDTGVDLIAGTEFNFVDRLSQYGVTSAGLRKFGVRGIDISANVDPNDVQAFVTGLSFVADGRFTGTQTPIVQTVAEDADGDGVPWFSDVCAGTASGELVDQHGCSSAQRLEMTCPADGDSKNLGRYVKCVVHEVRTQVTLGLLKRYEARALLRKLRFGRAKHVRHNSCPATAGEREPWHEA